MPRITSNLTPRRHFLKTSLGALALGSVHPWSSAQAETFRTATERPVVGCIGTSTRGRRLIREHMTDYADVAVICDLDSRHAAAGKQQFLDRAGKGAKAPDMEQEYRRVLERKDIDAVVIATMEHWHTKIAIEAMLAGKDVYCEKPLTLSVGEGRLIERAQQKTGRVFQVGTQQRSECNSMFLKAIAMVQGGRLGMIRKVTVAVGTAPSGGPFPIVAPPKELDWDKWLGPCKATEYREGTTKGWVGLPDGRGHGNYRWWYEYSCGKITDWGAHHVDIAQWAIGQNGLGQGPIRIEPILADHPVPLKDGMPTDPSRYNVATKFHVKAVFPGDIELHIRDNAPELGFSNGIMFEGTKGRIFVNRGKLTGKPVEDLATSPLPDDAITKLYGGKKPVWHMQNFVECVKSREAPISDVATHNCMLRTCILSTIAMRLGRPIAWDAKTQRIADDPIASQFLFREPRKGYEYQS